MNKDLAAPVRTSSNGFGENIQRTARKNCDQLFAKGGSF